MVSCIAKSFERSLLISHHSGVYRDSLSIWNWFRSPRVFRVSRSTVIVTWLIKIMSNDLPAIQTVDLDYETTVDLHLAADCLGITRNESWIRALLASGIASNPWRSEMPVMGVTFAGFNMQLRILPALSQSYLNMLYHS